MLINRRSLLVGTAATLLAAPAVVRASSLMPVRTPIVLRPTYRELVYVCTEVVTTPTSVRIAAMERFEGATLWDRAQNQLNFSLNAGYNIQLGDLIKVVEDENRRPIQWTWS